MAPLASFVIPRSVNLNEEQLQILSSLGHHQGIPFCLNTEGKDSSSSLIFHTFKFYIQKGLSMKNMRGEIQRR